MPVSQQTKYTERLLKAFDRSTTTFKPAMTDTKPSFLRTNRDSPCPTKAGQSKLDRYMTVPCLFSLDASINRKLIMLRESQYRFKHTYQRSRSRISIATNFCMWACTLILCHYILGSWWDRVSDHGIELEDTSSPFAYALYTTNIHYFCNALINTRRLQEFGVKYDIALIYPEDWDQLEDTTSEQTALDYARQRFPSLKLHPMPLITTSSGDPTWSASLTKFNVFRLTNYSRIICFDTDALVLGSMDHYFFAPNASVALPRAYWLNDLDLIGESSSEMPKLARQTLGSHFMLLEPNLQTYSVIQDEATRSGSFDMEVVNSLFGGSAMILPHRHLALLSGEFRSRDHTKYLSAELNNNNNNTVWDAVEEIERSVLVHFSDWPLPKPWLPITKDQMDEIMPECSPSDVDIDRAREGRPECADRAVWLGLYEEYEKEKREVCDGHF